MSSRNRRYTSCILCSVILFYGEAFAADSQSTYRVSAEDSELAILVFSAGMLGGLGHNHVITSNEVTGTVVLGTSPADSSLDLTLAVDSLVVDDPEARTKAGSVFEGTVADDDRQGTRENMLGDKLLNAEKYGEIHVVSKRISGEFSDMTVEAEITVKGEQHDISLPVRATIYNDRIVAIGRAHISHEELGLSPFSAAFGTLRVSDEMSLKYRIVALPEP